MFIPLSILCCCVSGFWGLSLRSYFIFIFLVGVNVLLAEFYPVESFLKNFVRAGSEQPLHQDISVTLLRYMSAECPEWFMRTFHSNFSNPDDPQLFWEQFSANSENCSAHSSPIPLHPTWNVRVHICLWESTEMEWGPWADFRGSRSA